MSDSKELLINFAVNCVIAGFTMWAGYRLIDKLDPTREEKQRSKKAAEALKLRLQKSGRNNIEFTEYELIVAQDIIDPRDIDTSFDMIGGYEVEKKELKSIVTLPIRKPKLFKNHRLLSFPKGILLYGPPGTGKTMLVKAIAKESNAMFINLQLSTVFNMFFGESEKLIKAVFSLASKLSPCVLFIDEIDSFLRQRSGSDQAITGNIKAEFMQLWDGLLSSDENGGVMVIGASNRPSDIDEAFLRRLPRTFYIRLPNESEREEILRLMLNEEKLDSDFNFKILSQKTERYSGSDLKELCQVAALCPIKDAEKIEEISNIEIDENNIRAIRMKDFEYALTQVKPTGEAAYGYRAPNDVRNENGNIDIVTLLQLINNLNNR